MFFVQQLGDMTRRELNASLLGNREQCAATRASPGTNVSRGTVAMTTRNNANTTVFIRQVRRLRFLGTNA